MSLENAILEHASALRELSAAIKSMYAGRANLLADETKDEVKTSPAREAIQSALDAAKAGAKETETKPDAAAEVVKAVSDEIETKGTVEAGAADLDYAKDVRPVLLATIKAGKRAEIEAILARHGVAKADQLKPEQLRPVLAEVQKLAA